MRSREDLFQLIHSMSKSEKRYFVLDAKKSGRSGSRYLELFNTINRMGHYDDRALRKKFPQNPSSDKAYLYEAILRSMRDYRSPASKAAQVKERLMDARYLYERGLYGQSTQRIAEAKTIAAELEDQFTLLEINKEEQISLFDRKASVKLEHIEKLNEERTRTLEAIGEELRYLDLYYRLLLEVFRDFNPKDASSMEALKKRLPLELLDDNNKPASPQAVRRFYLCNAVYYNLLGELEKVYEYSLKAVQWWDSHPALKEEEFHRYIINVSNLVNTMYRSEQHAPLAQQWLDKLKQEKSSKGYHNQKVIFLKLSISNLLNFLNRNEFEKAHQTLPEIIAGLNKFGLRKSIVLTGNIATVNFLVRDFANCLQWTDHITRNLKTAGRQDIQRIVRIYAIIAHFERGDIDSTEAAMKAANRYYKSEGLPKTAFENVVLNKYLKNIFNAPVSEVKDSLAAFGTFLRQTKTE
ncbi:MAG: hypothetical protein ACE5FF_15905, partial [Saprospiraceae bacterium]